MLTSVRQKQRCRRQWRPQLVREQYLAWRQFSRFQQQSVSQVGGSSPGELISAINKKNKAQDQYTNKHDMQKGDHTASWLLRSRSRYLSKNCPNSTGVKCSPVNVCAYFARNWDSCSRTDCSASRARIFTFRARMTSEELSGAYVSASSLLTVDTVSKRRASPSPETRTECVSSVLGRPCIWTLFCPCWSLWKSMSSLAP